MTDYIHRNTFLLSTSSTSVVSPVAHKIKQKQGVFYQSYKKKESKFVLLYDGVVTITKCGILSIEPEKREQGYTHYEVTVYNVAEKQNYQ
jgi:hypothetical protein